MSGETIRLVNKTGAIQVLNLPHGLVPEAASMSVVGVRAHDLKSGERKVSLAKKGPVSGSVTILAGKSVDVPRSALRAPEVQAALNARPPRLALIEVKAAPAEPAKLPPGNEGNTPPGNVPAPAPTLPGGASADDQPAAVGKETARDAAQK
jgi:hypothetical protein